MANPNTELVLLNDRLNEMIRTLSTNLQAEIKAGIANGTSPEAVIRNLIQQVQTGTGRVGSLINALADVPTQTVRQIFTEATTQVSAGIALNQPPEYVLPRNQGYTISFNLSDGTISAKAPTSDDLSLDEKRRSTFVKARQEQRLMWVAIFVNTCEDCINLSGEVKTLAGWRSDGHWPGNGHTRCGANCKCQLVPVETMQARFGGESEQQIQQRLENGIQLQKRKIEELEALRGAKFADSTYAQKMGQVRNDFFNPTFEKREPLFIKTEPKTLGTGFLQNAETAYGE